MRSLPRGRVAGAVAVLLVVVGVAAWLLTRPHRVPGSEGILDRVRATPLAASSMTLNDGCFSGAAVQPAGRDSTGHQVYVLTFTLKGDPSTVADLVGTLDRPACAAAVVSATRSAQARLKSDPAFGELAVTYRTSAGARVQLP